MNSLERNDFITQEMQNFYTPTLSRTTEGQSIADTNMKDYKDWGARKDNFDKIRENRAKKMYAARKEAYLELLKKIYAKRVALQNAKNAVSSIGKVQGLINSFLGNS